MTRKQSVNPDKLKQFSVLSSSELKTRRDGHDNRVQAVQTEKEELAALPPKAFARVYDPDACDCVPLTGAARLILQAETDAWQGGTLMTVRL